jgi:hypothetical protein
VPALQLAEEALRAAEKCLPALRKLRNHPAFRKDEQISTLVHDLGTSVRLSSVVADSLAQLCAKLDALLEEGTEWCWENQIVGYVGEEPLVEPRQVPHRDPSYQLVMDTRPVVKEAGEKISRLQHRLDLEIELEILRRERLTARQERGIM